MLLWGYLIISFFLLIIVPIAMGYCGIDMKSFFAVGGDLPAIDNDDVLIFIIAIVCWPFLVLISILVGFVLLVENGARLITRSIAKNLFAIGARLAKHLDERKKNDKDHQK